MAFFSHNMYTVQIDLFYTIPAVTPIEVTAPLYDVSGEAAAKDFLELAAVYGTERSAPAATVTAVAPIRGIEGDVS